MARRIAVTLLFGFLALSGGLWAQPKKQTPPPPKPQEQQSEPPEEDEALKPKEYSFNPLQAEKELRIGNYYFKKGKYTAAANRFTEATKWNPNFADAFLRLGDAQEKLHDSKAAREAYQKYVDLAPDGKDTEHIKKKLAGKS
ncbi:MAG TPA: tetratricopeptide repeat protein [Bryobacteraceae bacterium]|nr:tetratricopeptide repeat protein [Bryobacteraceae bacterium]